MPIDLLLSRLQKDLMTGENINVDLVFISMTFHLSKESIFFW